MQSTQTPARSSSTVLLLFAALTLAGCRNGEGPSGLLPPSAIRQLHEIGTISADTVDEMAGPLVVEALDDHGRTIPGAEVRFDVDTSAGTQGNSVAYVSRVDYAYRSRSIVDTTDALGRAAAIVIHGERAGTANVKITGSVTGTSTSVPVTTNAGAPYAITASPSDTAVYAGANYMLRVKVTDRHKNLLNDSPTITGPASVDLTNGMTVTAKAIDRVELVLRDNQATTNVALSIVPRGTIAAGYAPDNGATTALAVLNLDGSAYRIVYARAANNIGGWQPRWAPNGNDVVVAGGYYDDNLYIIDTGAGTRRPLLANANIRSFTWPEYSRDGAWVYFTGNPIPISPHLLYRVHPDGSGLEQLTSYTSSYDLYNSPSPSTDGTHVAYSATLNSLTTGATLQIFDVASQTGADLGMRASSAQWSPVDNRIVVFDQTPGGANDLQALVVVNADGTGAHVLVRGLIGPSVDWSPDGKWVIARVGTTLAVIDAQSGLVLPLPFTTTLTEPTWRPW